MNTANILDLGDADSCACDGRAIKIDRTAGKYHIGRQMKPPVNRARGFSLVELTLALGVAAFCLIALAGLLPISLKTQQASIEQTIANGVMTEILGDLRADVRLPPGQASKEDPNNGGSGFGLHGHWAQVRTPDTLYFTNEGKWTGQLNASSPPADAALRAKITYLWPPNAATSVAKITVSWPPQVDPTAPGAPVPAGFVETFIAVNR
jgi:type II secretory pathway pseudopilin PulG